MPPRLCPRCHSTLHREDEATLIFCWNCGAPQVRLSEELLDQLQHQQEATATSPSTPNPASDPGAIVWSGAIQTAALTGLIALVLALVTLVLPPVVLLSIFWFIGAPVVALGLYHARFRHSRITPAFGARLGALCGVAMVVTTTVLHTIELLLARFTFHATAQLDQQITTVFNNAAARATATSGGDPLNMTAMLAIPEYRVGFILLGFAMFFVLYLALSATAGAFAGYLRRDARQA